MQEVKLLYKVPEAAEVLALSRAKVYQLIQSGSLKSIKVDGSRRIKWVHLVEYVADLDRAA